MSDADVNRALGQMMGTLNMMQRQFEEERSAAAASRRGVYERLDAIHADSKATAARVETLERVVQDEVRPVVRSVVDWRARMIGAFFVLGAIGSAILFALTYGKELVIEWMRGWGR